VHESRSTARRRIHRLHRRNDNCLFSFKKARHLFRRAESFCFCLVICGVTAGMLPSSRRIPSPMRHPGHRFTLRPSDSRIPGGSRTGHFPGGLCGCGIPLRRWNGSSGYWWSEANTNQVVVDSMLSRSLRTLTGKSTDPHRGQIVHIFQRGTRQGERWIQCGEKIAVKINLNTPQPGESGQHVTGVAPDSISLLRQLVNNAEFLTAISHSTTSSVTYRIRSIPMQD